MGLLEFSIGAIGSLGSGGNVSMDVIALLVCGVGIRIRW